MKTIYINPLHPLFTSEMSQAIKLIEQECTENGTTLQEALQYTTLSQLADDLGYCFIE